MITNNKRIMVDMSATIIHHGHIRLIKRAAEYGSVIVGLTADDEILVKKHYEPELSFQFRKEILESIQYVTEVVSTPWLIDDTVLAEHKIDLLVHGDDNVNIVDHSKLLVLPRTEGISSSEVRSKVLKTVTQINNQKLMLTPGPSVVLHENLKNLKPLFGRGDKEFMSMADAVTSWVKNLSGQDEVVMAQGSSTFALELAAHTFVNGKVLIISTGYYSDRLEKLLPKNCEVEWCEHDDISQITYEYDWVLCAYTETSTGFKVDLKAIKDKCDQIGAKLYVDATGSIGLEDYHHLADVMAFSSCKGLFGLTGACFVAYKRKITVRPTEQFYFNLQTHQNKMVTGPYHAVASLFGVMDSHNVLKQRVINSKKYVLQKWGELARGQNQPLLCTYLQGKVIPKDSNVVLYSPRTESAGSVVCHFGEIHKQTVSLEKRIDILPC